ncbi:MAG: ABC transporter permease subunit [Actinomycetota bacterium]
MATELARRFVVDRIRSTIGWVIGLGLYTGLIVSFFPSIRDSQSYEAALEDYPDALKEFFGGDAGFQLTTGPGFINAQLFAFMVPLLLAVVAIGYGAALGGEQQSGLIDLVLANPIRRRRVIVERAVAMLATIFLLAFTVLLVVTVLGRMVDLGIDFSRLAAATVATVLVVMVHGLVALAVAGATGSRSVAVGSATVIFAAGYLLNALSGLVGWLEPMRVLSPYYHAVGPLPLLEGWALPNLVVLVALCFLVLAAGVVLFERRDLV